ncbi:MAG: hypothetical protein WCH05_06265 [Chlorobiaceae bacterium]
MITALLVIILLLLAAVVALLVTGWPGRELREIEATGRDLRRELAEHRTGTMQMLHAMRIELDESLREAVEQQFESLAAATAQSATRRRKAAPPKPEVPAIASSEPINADGNQEEPSHASVKEPVEPPVDDRQFGLFAAKLPKEKLHQQKDEADEIRIDLIESKEPLERVESLSIGYDDIPDIEDLHHFENL